MQEREGEERSGGVLSSSSGSESATNLLQLFVDPDLLFHLSPLFLLLLLLFSLS
jgi:hypothetical protein